VVVLVAEILATNPITLRLEKAPVKRCLFHVHIKNE
jgi:hypothetical protein